MINIEKMFLSVLGIALSFGISTANAQEEEKVLFRINEIVPIKNSDNNVYACDFSITFHNGSKNNISGASLDLTWEDKTIDEFIENENKVQELESNRRTSRNRRNTTTNTSVGLSVEVPSIRASQQGLVKTRIQTDKCFLLLENPTVRVKSCRVDAPEESSRARTSSANLCVDLFSFVSPKTPEYYSNFNELSLEADARKLSEKEKIENEIETEFKNTVSKFEEANQALKL